MYSFADYDAIVVVGDPERALRTLENAMPVWRGKELNLGIYSASELWSMQLLSGDNLAEYGVCVFGEVDLPHKPIDVLLARNFSFGIIRLRQQLGMIATALQRTPTPGDDRRNLFGYFVKIPANIAKGTFGAVGQRLSKEQIHDWLFANCGFDTSLQQAIALSGNPASALAQSAVATSSALGCLNKEIGIIEPLCATEQTRRDANGPYQ
jgi:hypothetical protein